MSEKPLNSSPGDWSCPAQICFLPSWFNVSYNWLRKFTRSLLTVCRPELFDEYTRRQYVAKAPDRNPFGTEEEAAKFSEFDVFTKVCFCEHLMEAGLLTYDLRSEFYSSLHNGPWETPIVSVTE
jgi:hypothetical protein